MKKITARDFQKKFGSIDSKMRPGESLEVTRHGKPSGRYTKAGHRPVKIPNISKRVALQPIDPKVGGRLIREYIGE